MDNQLYPLEIAENEEIHSFTWSTTNKRVFIATERRKESEDQH